MKKLGTILKGLAVTGFCVAMLAALVFYVVFPCEWNAFCSIWVLLGLASLIVEALMSEVACPLILLLVMGGLAFYAIVQILWSTRPWKRAA